jgi:hypothetical protein
MFGKVLDVEKNVSPGLSRSVFVTFYEREVVARALNVLFFIFLFLYFFIYLFFFNLLILLFMQHPDPIIINGGGGGP